MVQTSTIRAHSMPVVIARNGAYWDGPISSLVMFQGKLGVIWRSMDVEMLNERDYPQDVWDKILSKTDDDWTKMQTRDYRIDQEQELASDRLEWRVFTKNRYMLYTRENMTREDVNLYNYGDNNFKTQFRCLGEFIDDEIDWSVVGRYWT